MYMQDGCIRLYNPITGMLMTVRMTKDVTRTPAVLTHAAALGS